MIRFIAIWKEPIYNIEVSHMSKGGFPFLPDERRQTFFFFAALWGKEIYYTLLYFQSNTE